MADPQRTPDEIRSIIQQLIEADPQRRHTVASLGKFIGGNNGYLREFLSGKKNSLKASAIMQIEKIYDLAPGYLIGETTEPFSGGVAPTARRLSSGYRAPPNLVGDATLPVYAAVEGGPGEMVVTTDPIDVVARPWFLERIPDAFGIVVTGESMSPVYEPGEIVLINPKLPAIKGRDAVFIGGEPHGEFRATLKRYEGQTTTHWLARRFSPPSDVKFEKRDWPRVLRVVGKYSA